MGAPLESFLRAITSGSATLSPEMYQHFGGDDILAQLQKYDPNAKWTDTELGGGEGGSQGWGKRLDFDVTKLPKSQKGTAGYDLNPANLHTALPGSKSYADSVYGDVRNSKEFAPDKEALWTKLAPLAVATLAPMAGAALAGAGIGGVAGLTAGVTGSGVSGNAASWLANLVKQGPGMLTKANNGGGFDIMSLLPYAGQAAGINPMLIKGGMTLAQLVGKRG